MPGRHAPGCRWPEPHRRGHGPLHNCLRGHGIVILLRNQGVLPVLGSGAAAAGAETVPGIAFLVAGAEGAAAGGELDALLGGGGVGPDLRGRMGWGGADGGRQGRRG